MKILSLSLLAILASVSAHAETFKCTFTEPFVDVVYTTGTQELVVDNVSAESKQVIQGATLTVVAPGIFSIQSKSKEVLRLTLDFKGSDGMSNNVYPYSALTTLIEGPNSGIGGCSSSALPVKIVDGDQG